MTDLKITLCLLPAVVKLSLTTIEEPCCICYISTKKYMPQPLPFDTFQASVLLGTNTCINVTRKKPSTFLALFDSSNGLLVIHMVFNLLSYFKIKQVHLIS